MFSPPFRFRLLPVACTVFAASLGLVSLLAGSLVSARSARPAPHAPASTALHLSNDGASPELMFVSLPGIGNAVMSLRSDGKPVFSPVTLHQDELTFFLDGHQLDLSGICLPQGSHAHATHFLLHLDRDGSRTRLAPAAHPTARVAAL